MAEQELTQWKGLAASITDDDRVRHAPPPMVWDNIEAALANTNKVVPPVEAPASANVPDNPADLPSLSVVPQPDDEVVPPEAVIDLNEERNRLAPATKRKQRRHMFLAGAAAALALVIGVSLLTQDDEPEQLAVPTLAAEVTNDTLPEAFDGTASASLALDDAPMLEISFDSALPSDEPVELWLIKPDLSDMRSLGIVQPGATAWSGDWPADLDPAEYSVVDLSIEPNDGDPTHSGRSILRGVLA